MKLSQMTLQNIRCHQSASFNLGRVTLIAGPNDSGKTTLANALEFALTGKYSHVHGNGNGTGAELVTEGEDVGSVVLTTAAGQVARDTRNGLSLSWAPRAGAREAQHELELQMGCTAEKARLALSGVRFLRMDHKEQKSLLQDMLNLTIDPARVENELTRLGALEGLPLIEVVHSLGGRHAACADFTKLYKNIYEERTFAKRSLAELNQTVKTLQERHAEQVFVPEDQIALLEQQKATVEATVSELLETRGRRAAAQGSQTELENYLAQLQRQKPQVPDLTSTDSVEAIDARIEKCEGLLESLRKEQVVAIQRASHRESIEKSLAFYTNLAESKMLEPGGKCLKCGEPLPEAKEAADKYEKDIAHARSERDKLQNYLAELDANPEKLQPLDVLRTRIQAGTTRVNELKQLRQAAHGAERTVAALSEWESRVKKTQQDLENVRQTLEGIANVDEDLATAKSKLSGLVQQLGSALEYKESAKRLSAQTTKQAELSTRVQALEFLVPWYSPNGYQLEHTARQIGGLEKLLNKWLEPFGLQGRWSDGLTLELSRDGGPFVPYTRAADSGYILAGFALQMAFAEYTGLSIVVMDRLESLWPERRKALLDFCAALEGGPDHIFLIGAVEIEDVPSGVTLIKLDAARVEVAS